MMHFTVRSTRALLVASLVGLLATADLVTPREAHAQRDKDKEKEKDIESISLSIGETKTIPAAGIRNFSLATEGIAELKVSPESFVITGKKQGETSLLLIRNDGRETTYSISVSARPIAVVEREVRQLIGDYPGIQVRRIGNKLFIEGGVNSALEKKRFDQIASLYPGQVDALVNEGSSPRERKLLLRLDFFFVYYEKTSSYAVGIGWPATIGGTNGATPVFTTDVNLDLISGTVTSARASIVNQPLPRLDIGARNGWAKVTKQSTVITGNGSEAKFSSGGEQNYLQTVGLTQGLVSVRFGTNITVLPRFDSVTRDVEVKLDADVADLTPPASGTIPGRNTTQLQTLVTLKLGQALVLSGLKTETKRNDIQGLPLLSQIPVLGVLFGSHAKAAQEVEAAIFIVPSVVDSVPSSSLDVIRNAMATYDEFSGGMKGLDTFPSTPPSATKAK